MRDIKIPAMLIVGALLSGCSSDQSNESSQTMTEGIGSYPLLPLQQLLAPASFVVPQISPDGKYISYIAPLDGVPNLYVAETDNPGQARAVTQHTDNGVRATDVSGQVMYRWHYDSKKIIYPKDYDGDEHWDIHVADVESGEDRNLTPFKDKKVEVIAYGRASPDEALVSIEVFGSRQPDVYRLDLATGDLELVQENGGFLGFFGDNELNIRLGIKFTSEGGLDFLAPPVDANAEWSSVYQVAATDLPALVSSVYQKVIKVDESNEHVFLYDAQGRDKAALVSVDLRTGDTQVIAEDDRVDIGGVLYHPVSNKVQGYATNWMRNRWHAADESVAADFSALDRMAEGDWRVLGRSDDDSKWIVQYMLSHKPIEFYLYDQQSKSGTMLFTATPQLEGLELSKLHPYVVTTDDGFDLVSYLMLPPWTDPDEDGRPEQPVPVIVLVHGGPSDERAQFAFGPFLHWLSNRGYGMLYVNFRGSAGFGKAYMNGQKMEWGGKMHQDILDQVHWAIDEGIADPGKVAILGGSYGGYEALVGMTMTPDVFACGVDIVGPSNLEIFMPHWDEDTMGKTIGDPRTEEGRAFLRSRSPINFAHQTKNPVLIGQGANDSRVPAEQSESVVSKMVDAGVDVTYVLYPDEGHGFQKPKNSMAFNAVMEVFLSECLGGRREEISDQIEGSSMQVPVGAEHIPGLSAALAARTDTGVPEITVVDVAPAVLKSYAGDYKLENYDVSFTITWTGEQLMFEMPGQAAAELFPTSSTEFFFKVAPSTVGFFLSDDGSPSHLVLYSNGSETRANREN